MYHIHKYMGYNNAQEQYTNLQFYLSAKSLGFEERDARQIWDLLFHLFSQRCETPKSVPEWAEPALQSICTDVSDVVWLGELVGFNADESSMIVRCRGMLCAKLMIRSTHLSQLMTSIEAKRHDWLSDFW
jgi:hypothetical protein